MYIVGTYNYCTEIVLVLFYRPSAAVHSHQTFQFQNVLNFENKKNVGYVKGLIPSM